MTEGWKSLVKLKINLSDIKSLEEVKPLLEKLKKESNDKTRELLTYNPGGKMEGYDERACDCGQCRYCKAYLSSEDDYQGDEYECSRCNGGGCTKCEE